MILSLAVTILFQSTWILFIDDQRRFEVTTPSALIHRIDTIDTSIGRIEFHNFQYNCLEGCSIPAIYQVQYYTSDELVMPLDSTELIDIFFDATIEESANVIGGEVIFSDSITYDGHYPGRFWRIHYDEGKSVMKVRAFVVQNTYYSIQVATKSEYSLSEEINQFLESLRILGV